MTEPIIRTVSTNRPSADRSGPRLCIDCVYCTVLTSANDASKRYECGNPDYALIDRVDGRISYLTCEKLRQRLLLPNLYELWCGPNADGFLPILPESSAPRVTVWQKMRWELKNLWDMRKHWFNRRWWRDGIWQSYLRDWWRE